MPERISDDYTSNENLEAMLQSEATIPLVKDMARELLALHAERDALYKALHAAMPWIGEPAAGPSWATHRAAVINKEMCRQAFADADTALNWETPCPKE